jgi:sulfate transport system permease protein
MRRFVLRTIALGYLAVLLMAPVGWIAYRALEHGVGPFWSAVTSGEALSAFKLTLLIAAIVVPLNTIFGVLCALAIVRQRIPGKGFVNAIVDLPLALSPVVVGLSLFLLYGRGGWLGDWLMNHGLQVLFALPAMVLATAFVSLPFVVREVVPVLREIGVEQEQAAATLGASHGQIFFRITLPAIRWAVAYGVVLTAARSLGEYGAVSVVSGHFSRTQTATILVDENYLRYDYVGAYGVSLVLALMAIVVLLAMSAFRPKEGSY